MAVQIDDSESGFYDEIFDFDFSDVSIVGEDENAQCVLSLSKERAQGTLGTSYTSKKRSTATVKSKSLAVRGKQFMKKVAVSEALQKPVPYEVSRDTKPNVSKRSPSDILYAFPNFDKSDSLLYFPHTMTRHMNSGDMEGLKRLMLSHADRKCQVSLQENLPPLTPRSLLTMSTIMHDVRPDMIMCVRSTQVIDNTICARAYWKYTDVQTIYVGVVDTIIDPALHSMFTRKRSRRIRSGLLNGIEERTPEEQQQLVELVDSDVDVLIYGVVDITVTFDPISKKIVRLAFVPKLTSLHPIV